MGKKKTPKVFAVHGPRRFRLKTVNGHVVRVPVATPPRRAQSGPWFVTWKLVNVDEPALIHSNGALDGADRFAAYLNAAREMVRLAKIELAMMMARRTRKMTTHPRCESFAAQRRRALTPRPRPKRKA